MKRFKTDVVLLFGFLMLCSFGLTILNREKKNPLFHKESFDLRYNILMPEKVISEKKNHTISMQEVFMQTGELIQSRSVDVLVKYLQYVRSQLSLSHDNKKSLETILTVIDTFVKDTNSPLTIEDKIQLIISIADRQNFSHYFELLLKYDFLYTYKKPLPVIAFEHNVLGTVPLLITWSKTKEKMKDIDYSGLLYALHYNDKFPKMFESLYKAGLRVDDDLMKSLIYELVFRNEEGPAFDFLMKQGANINYLNRSSQMTPLMLAAKTNKIKLVKKLIKAGANISKKSKKKNVRSALDLARENKNIEIEALLLDYGAK